MTLRNPHGPAAPERKVGKMVFSLNLVTARAVETGTRSDRNRRQQKKSLLRFTQMANPGPLDHPLHMEKQKPTHHQRNTTQLVLRTSHPDDETAVRDDDRRPNNDEAIHSKPTAPKATNTSNPETIPPRTTDPESQPTTHSSPPSENSIPPSASSMTITSQKVTRCDPARRETNQLLSSYIQILPPVNGNTSHQTRRLNRTKRGNQRQPTSHTTRRYILGATSTLTKHETMTIDITQSYPITHPVNPHPPATKNIVRTATRRICPRFTNTHRHFLLDNQNPLAIYPPGVSSTQSDLEIRPKSVFSTGTPSIRDNRKR